MSAIFITATGTEVGKTYVAASLIRHLQQIGKDVIAIKPVVSGFDPEKAAESDPGILLSALGAPPTLENIEMISPWCFRAPLSPDLAARMEGKRIDVDEVIAFCQRAIADNPGVVLIEGIGGIMVPLDGQQTVLDLMMALQAPLILVTGSYLGSISHTLNALDSLFAREMDVMSVIVNETPGSSVPLDEVVATLTRFGAPAVALSRASTGESADLGGLLGGGS